MQYQSKKSAAYVRNLTFERKDLQTARCQTFFLYFDLEWFDCLTKIRTNPNQIIELKNFKFKSLNILDFILFYFFKSNTLHQVQCVGVPFPHYFLYCKWGFWQCSRIFFKNKILFFYFFLTFRGRCLKKTTKKSIFFNIFNFFHMKI